MKKVLCTVLSVAILVLSISVSFPVFAHEIEMKQIESFSADGIDLVQKYDEGKNFEAVTEETDEFDDLQFQTARLFVKCSSKFDKMGAEEVVSGFQNWHILQFDSPKTAKKAYQYYSKQEKIERVEPDIPIDAELDAKADKVYVTREEFDNDYAKKILGTNDVLQYIENHNIKTSEIKIGLLDSGIDYNHELFEDRLFRTYFNTTPTGDKGDEFDIKIANAHGTGTTSCVLSTTPDTVKVGCYKTLDEKGEDYDTEVSWITSALQQAYADGCSIINMSFSVSVNSEYFKEVLIH